MATRGVDLESGDPNKNSPKNGGGISIRRQLRPAWIGLGVGLLLCIVFLLFSKPADGPPGFTRYHFETADGKGGSISAEAAPFFMPVAGFFVGLVILVYRKVKERD